MTTSAEVKRWTKGILAEHPDLVLEKRYLYLRPMHHIYRAVGFLGSSERTFPKPTALFGVLFAPPMVPKSHTLGLQLRVMYSTDANFEEDLAKEIRDALTTLRRMDSIEGFYDLTHADNLIWNIPCTGLSWSPELQAAVLAALGHLPDALRVADAVIEKDNEPRLLTMLAEAEELLARRPRSSDARYRVETATYWLKRLDGTKRLRERLAANDRAGIAALLHAWEQERVQSMGIAHLWEPTPFPVELS